MALALYDRVQETTTTSGTGTITLNGAVAGFQSFAVIGNGNTCYYTIVDNGAWEVGIGTYSSTGPTLARTTILSNSNANTSPINLSGGTANVFVTYPAEKSVNLDAAGNVSPLGTISSGTWQGSTVGVAYGGTGVTSSSGANSVVLRDSNENISVNRVAQKRALTTASGGTTALTVGSAFLQTLVGTGGQTFTLPDATLVPVGTWFLFDNDATGTLTIQDYATGAIDVVPPGGYVLVILEDNSTVAGIWIRTGLIPAEAHWGTNSLDLGGSTVITNGVWQGSTVGVAYGGTGLNSISAANYALYSTGLNTLTAGTLPVAAGGTGATAIPTNGQLLIGNGSSYSVASLTAGTGISTSVGSGSLTINNTAPMTYPSAGIANSTGTSWGTSYTTSGTGTEVALTGNPTFSGITDSGNLTFTGTGNRITGDFSNATIANRVAFQTSTTNGNTTLSVIPNGTGTQGIIDVYANSDPTNTNRLQLISGATFTSIRSGISGTGTYQPLTIFTSGSEVMRIDTSGNVGIGTSSPLAGVRLDTFGGYFRLRSNTTINADISGNVNALVFESSGGTGEHAIIAGGNTSTNFLSFYTANATTPAERMRIDSSGNVGIGTSSPQARLSVSNAGAAGFEFYANYPGGGTGTYIQSYNRSGSAYVNTAYYALSHTFWANGSDRMVIDSSGNVGIGTSSPSYPLDVVGNVNGSVTSAVQNSNSGTAGFARFLAIANGGNAQFGMTSTGYTAITNAQDAMLFNANGASGGIVFAQEGVAQVKIDSSGNVGIGTSSPGAKLHVSSGATDEVIRIQATSSPYISTYSGSTRVGYVLGSSSAYSVYSDGAIPLILGTNSTERMRIDSSGNVGIGVTNPTSRLNVAGNVYVDGNTTVRNATATNGIDLTSDGNIEIIRAAGDPFIDFKTSTAEDYDCRIQQISNGLTFQTGGNGAASERMRITANGGISFGSSGTAYGTAGQVLTSNGDAAPTWQAPTGGISIGQARALSINCILP